MAVHAQIGLADGKATPVTHIFQPARRSTDFASWEERTSGVYIGYEKLTMSLTRPKGPSKTANRELTVTAKLEMPVLETLGTSDSGLTPPPTVAHRPWVEVIYHLPDRSTAQQRKDLRTMFGALHASSQFQDAIDNFAVPA